MLDKILYDLINRYGIFDTIEEIQTPLKKEGRWKGQVKNVIGLIRLAKPLNAKLDTLTDKNVAFCGERGRFLALLWQLILPKNRNKIRFFLTKRKESDSYYGRKVIEVHEINRYHIKTIVLFTLELEWSAELLGRQFKGMMIELRSLIRENHLESLFYNLLMRKNPYAEIYIARKKRDFSTSIEEKQLWHKKVIAHCLCARDFLNAREEIEAYKKGGYKDVERYCSFWEEMEKLLCYIKERLSAREQRDVYVFWLDQMEKKEFYSMNWLGNHNDGIIFDRVYTTMVNTRAILYSILTGKNVKTGNLMSFKIIDLSDTIFSKFSSIINDLIFYSANFQAKLGKDLLHDCYKEFYPVNCAPFMIGMWNALDLAITSSKSQVSFFHCMETHCTYPSAITSRGEYECENVFRLDFTKVAEKTREYIDQQLEWYHDYLSPHSVCIFMSDHGSEFDLTEQNINVPFKIIGKDLPKYYDNRLFSLKNMHKLIASLLQVEKLNNVFEREVIIDVIDPYEKSFLQCIKRGELWKHFSLDRRKRSREELKKYLQATKVVTAEGEYYSVNILGEETYYRDTECKINLIDNPAFAERVAELREKAGKFYNPWKEKRKVAIDFYEYLGIEEKDIIAQCY